MSKGGAEGLRLERHRVRGAFRLGILLSVPVMLLVSAYLTALMVLQSTQGNLWVTRWVDDLLPGGLEIGRLEVGGNLFRFELYDATLTDLRGREVIHASGIVCTYRPLALLTGRVLFDQCEVSGGRVLVDVEPDGRMGLNEAFNGMLSLKGEGPVPRVIFDEIRAEGLDAVLQFGDALIRLDDLSLHRGRVISDGNVEVTTPYLKIRSGRVLLTEAGLGLGVGNGTWEEVEWNALRRARPWAAAFGPAPKGRDGLRGVLDIPLTRVTSTNFRWYNEGMNFDMLKVEMAGDEARLSGSVQVLADTPKVPSAEAAGLRYEGELSVSLGADSPFVGFVLPGAIQAGAGQQIGASGYGSLRFYEGGLRLAMQNLVVLGHPIEAFSTEMKFSHGRMTLGGPTVVRAWGGRTELAGWWTPEDGRWDVRGCVQQLGLRRLLLPYVQEPVLDLVGSAQLSVGGKDCVASKGGLHAWGDLSVKSFHGYSHVGLPGDRAPLAPMVELDATEVAVSWPEGSPLPDSLLEGAVAATVDARGWVALRSKERPWAVDLVGATTALRATGDWDLERMSSLGMKFEGQLLDLGRLLPKQPLAAGLRVGGSGSFSGPWNAPTSFDVTGRISSLREHPLLGAFTADASFRRDGGAVRFLEMQYRSTRGEVEGRGTVGLFSGGQIVSDPKLALEGAFRGMRPELWLKRSELVGGVDGRASISGTVRHPQASGEVYAAELSVVGEPVRQTRFGFEGGLEGGVVRGFSAELLGGVVRGEASVGSLPERRLAGRFSVAGAELGASALLRRMGLAVEGEPWGFAVLGGSLAAPEIGGSLVVEKLKVQGFDLRSVSMTFDTLEGVVSGYGMALGEVPFSLQVPLDGRMASMEARLDEIRPLAYLPQFADSAFDALVSGEVKLQADLRDLSTMGGSVRVDALEVRSGTQSVTNPEPIELTWSRGLEADSLHDTVTVSGKLGAKEQPLSFGGSLRDWREVRGEATGVIDLALLGFLPALVKQSSGRADVSLEVSGLLENPDLRGVVTNVSGRVTPSFEKVDVAVTASRLEVASGMLTIPEVSPLRAVLWGGTADVSGSYQLFGARQGGLAMQASFDNLTYRIPREFAVTVGGKVQLTAADARSIGGWRVAGDVELLEGRYIKPIELIAANIPGAVTRVVSARTQPIWQRSAWVGALETDLAVRGRDRLYVQSRVAGADLQVELETNVQVRGPLKAMVMTGDVKSRDGSSLTFRGKSFEVLNATMNFDGERDPTGLPSPTVDAQLRTTVKPCALASSSLLNATARGVSAVTAIPTIAITARVQGRAPSALDYVLSSTPSYDQRDQMALLITGCTVDSLTAARAGAPTLDVVLRPVLDMVERNVEESFSLDDFTLAPSTVGTASISIQDQPSEKFIWSLSAALGGLEGTQQNAQGIIRLLDWLSLELREQSVGTEGSVEAGVRLSGGGP